MKSLVINVNPLETRIALLEDKRLAELIIEREEDRSVVGNIYKGRVDAIIPGIQAAFIDIGFEKNGFLYVSDIAGAEGTGDIELEHGVPRAKSRKKRAHQQAIETMMKKNQYVMVQVSKDRLGTKGPRLTNFITFPGRYLVLLPTINTLGVSRKIESGKERDRLRKVLRELRPKGMGIISRTACEGRTREELKEDIDYLVRAWDKTRANYERSRKTTLLREDLGPILRSVRDLFKEDFDRLTIDSEVEYGRIMNFLDQFAPKLKKKVRLYKEKKPLFEKMGVEEEIEKALRRKVYLKSGGYIAIDHTEALIAIDVNTGKFTGKKQLEDTVLQTNLEAAEEIARQLRLRDMGGIIVLDFIDMEYSQNRRTLIKRFREALRHDRARITLSEVSELGMIEMTRKRVKHNLIKALSQHCPYCEGSGMVRSVTTVTFDTLRKLQSLFCATREKHIILQAHPDVTRRLRGENSDLLKVIADRFSREVSIESVSDFHIHEVHFLRARNRKEIELDMLA
ncbi:MAG: Rne/Rng family ribonuclease [Candidatus Hydrogenedens sp.]|jgi:ribonuclease G|nr:Rne/Rng family ribonuclease [Candidatus Hydrogenedens sp.]